VGHHPKKPLKTLNADRFESDRLSYQSNVIPQFDHIKQHLGVFSGVIKAKVFRQSHLISRVTTARLHKRPGW
jgi:hypothetical protein